MPTAEGRFAVVMGRVVGLDLRTFGVRRQSYKLTDPATS